MMLYGKEMSDREIRRLLRSVNSEEEAHEILSALGVQRKLHAVKQIARETDPDRRFMMEELYRGGITDFSVLFGPAI